VDCPPGLYERLLDAAEKWDEPIAVVMRAALERGLDALSAFPGDPRRSPFEAGMLDRAPSRIDPTGTHYPPPPAPYAAPSPARPPQPYAPAQPPLPPVESYTESVWDPGLPPGLLPSGGFGAPPREKAKAPQRPPDDFRDFPLAQAPAPDTYAPPPADPPPEPEPPAFEDPFADSEEAVARAMAEVQGEPQIDGAQALTDDLAGLL
jgi:hypothetical protein